MTSDSAPRPGFVVVPFSWNSDTQHMAECQVPGCGWRRPHVIDRAAVALGVAHLKSVHPRTSEVQPNPRKEDAP